MRNEQLSWEKAEKDKQKVKSKKKAAFFKGGSVWRKDREQTSFCFILNVKSSVAEITDHLLWTGKFFHQTLLIE